MVEAIEILTRNFFKKSDVGSSASSGFSGSSTNGTNGYSATDGESSSNIRLLAEAQARAVRADVDELRILLVNASISSTELIKSAEKLRSLNAQLSDLSSYLTAYEIATLQTKIRELQSLLVSKQQKQTKEGLSSTSTHAPTTKFGFRRRAVVDKPVLSPIPVLPKCLEQNAVNVPALGADATSLSNNVILVDQKDVLNAKQLLISNRHDECLDLHHNDIDQRDIVLKNLVGCTIKLLGTPSSVHIENVTNCHILCGPVFTSVFVSLARNCTFLVACQQLRIHTTTHCDFYIYVSTTGGAIIEDTHDVRFAPYAPFYAEIWTDVRAVYPEISLPYVNDAVKSDAIANADAFFAGSSKWRDVVDFNYPFSGSVSPNWTIMPESERKKWNIA